MLISAASFASSVAIPESSTFVLGTTSGPAQYAKVVLDLALYSRYSYTYDPKNNLLTETDTPIATMAYLES